MVHRTGVEVTGADMVVGVVDMVYQAMEAVTLHKHIHQRALLEDYKPHPRASKDGTRSSTSSCHPLSWRSFNDGS